MSWRQWIRTVEIVPALGSADRATVEHQVDSLLRTGARVFHLRSGDDIGGALAMATDPPARPPPLRRGSRRPGRRPASPALFAAVADAGGNSVTFALDTAGDVDAALEAARAAGLAAGVAYAESADPVDVAERAGGADIVSCPSRNHFERLRELKLLARNLPEGTAIQVGRRDQRTRTHASCTTQVPGCLVVGTAIFQREDLPRAYRRLVQALA